MTLYDLAGRRQLQIRDPFALRAPIQVAPLPPGTYLVRWSAASRSGSLPLVVLK
jgi:hypothetical protein